MSNFPDRILEGSDLKYGKGQLARIEATNFLHQLPEHVTRKVAYENIATGLFHLNGNENNK